MKWLEVIELRSADRNNELIESRLNNLINEFDKKNKSQAIKVYCRVMIDTDFSIHLLNDSKNPDHGGSRLGLHLASALKAFGMVNHSVWIEMQSK